MEVIIKILNDLGYSILCIPELKKIFIINSFTVPEKVPSLGDIGFCTIVGIEMTSVVEGLSPNDSRISLKAKLENFIPNAPLMRMKFHRDYKWIEYVQS